MRLSIRRLLPKAARAHRVWSGPLKGSKIVTSWHDFPRGILGQNENGLLTWLETEVKPGETWLDIGANYGYISLAIARLVGSNGKVIAFEPFLSTACSLAKTRRLNQLPQLVVVPIGLGSNPRVLELVDLPSTRGMIDCTITTRCQTETVMLAHLDCFWPMAFGEIERIHGVKIDVQGMELAVMRGMIALLHRYQPRLAIEFHAGVDRNKILCLLAEAGYGLPGTPLDRSGDDHEYHDNCSYVFRSIQPNGVRSATT